MELSRGANTEPAAQHQKSRENGKAVRPTAGRRRPGGGDPTKVSIEREVPPLLSSRPAASTVTPFQGEEKQYTKTPAYHSLQKAAGTVNKKGQGDCMFASPQGSRSTASTSRATKGHNSIARSSTIRQGHLPGGQEREPHERMSGEEESSATCGPGEEEERQVGSINDWILPTRLAEVVARYPHQRTTLLTLLEQHSLRDESVTKTVFAHEVSFRLNHETVELQPALSVCPAHSGIGGCHSSNCLALHICPQHVKLECPQKECALGHDWQTDHNTRVLQHYYINSLEEEVLHQMVWKANDMQPNLPPLKLCQNYYLGNGCSGNTCRSLHVCYAFVKDKGYCRVAECRLSHTFADTHNQRLLEQHGVPANETPKEVLRALLDKYPGIPDDSNSEPESRTVVWSHDPEGDVPIPELCYASVEGEGDHSQRGCDRLHADRHYHWQVSKDGEHWLNLKHHQVDCLERTYSDPSQQGEVLPYLQALEPWASSLGEVLGNGVWLADFDSMKLVSREKTLDLRRLCTEKCEEEIAAATMLWYYESCPGGEWVQYGTDWGDGLVRHIDPRVIEERYREDPAQVIVYPSSLHKVEINFKTMTDHKERRVRRRVKPHLADNMKKDVQVALPPSWGPLAEGASYSLVKLPSFLEEYREVLDLLGECVKWVHPVRVERVQNPVLWRAYHGRVHWLGEQERRVDERHLFTAIAPSLLKVVCAENLDWWHQGSRNALAFGRGTYFYTNIMKALANSEPGPDGRSQVVVALVAVGDTVQGHAGLVRPPINPATDSPFLSTVDHEDYPSVVVKYNPLEYYPKYVLTVEDEAWRA